jgi:hypothetical protein
MDVMGRVSDWVLEMEQDAAEMNKEEFIKKHGKSQQDIWDKVNSPENEYDPEALFNGA